MDNCLKTGAYVHLADYGKYGAADIFGVGHKRVVRFNGNIEHSTGFEPERKVTHTLYLNQSENYWRKDLGIAVVDQDDLMPAINQG